MTVSVTGPATPPVAPAHTEPRPEVVVMIGLQGCGKSTWVKEHLAGTHVVVSKDFWPNARHREARRRRAVALALMAGLDVVVDDTNPSPFERASIIRIAHEHGATVRAVFIDTPVAECMSRIAGRTGRASVPVAGLLATRRRLVPPGLEEGFHHVQHVEHVDPVEHVDYVTLAAATTRPGAA